MFTFKNLAKSYDRRSIRISQVRIMQASRLGDGEHNSSAPGFGQTLDPFAVLDRKGQADDDDDGYNRIHR